MEFNGITKDSEMQIGERYVGMCFRQKEIVIFTKNEDKELSFFIDIHCKVIEKF